MNSLRVMSFASQFPFYGALNDAVQEYRHRQWIKQGRPMPPPHKVKQQVLQTMAKTQNLSALVETGTLFGDMIYAMRKHFCAIYSIEVFDPLFVRAVKRFSRMEHISILSGDSGTVLGELVKELDRPTLFWLDGHYSGDGTGKGEEDTPIFKELEAIFALKHNFAVAIDDARLFGTDPAYPSLNELTSFVHSKVKGLAVVVENDIIQIYESEAGA